MSVRIAGTALAALAVPSLIVAAAGQPAQAQAGHHFDTVVKTHGLKLQACLTKNSVLLVRGDGRGVRSYFALVTYQVTDSGGDDESSGSFGIVEGELGRASGSSASTEDVFTAKLKVYSDHGKTHVVGHLKKKVPVSTIGDC